MLSACLLASPAAFADGNECGSPDSDNTVTCDADTYSAGTGTGDDPGIEYDFGSSASDYTIRFPGYIDLNPTADSDHAFHGKHAGGGDLSIKLETFYGILRASGSGAHGIYGHHTGSGDLTIDMIGAFGNIEAKGTDGHAIYGKHEGTGALDIRISAGTVSSSNGEAIRLESDSTKTLTLRNISITTDATSGNAISFNGSSNGMLTIAGGGPTTIKGNVIFGSGTGDELVLNTCTQADVDNTTDTDCIETYGDLDLSQSSTFSGLENISKIGSGLVSLPGLDADGAVMSLEDGDLWLDGHLDLGATGVLTIHDASKLIFGGTSATDHGYITADKVKFADDDWQKLFLAGGRTLAAGSDLLRSEGSGAGKFYDDAGTTEVAPGLYDLSETPALLTTVTSAGVVSAEVSTDDLECGAPVNGIVICSETTYMVSTRGDDLGIEYDFGNSSTDYTINFEDDPDDDRVFYPVTLSDGDHLLHAQHAGGGDLYINVAADIGSITTWGSGAHGIYGQHTGDGDLTISAGGRIITRGSGAHAIYGYHENSGDIDVQITDSTVDTWVSGADTIRLVNGDGRKTVTLRNSVIWPQDNNAILFSGDSDDLLTVGGTTRIVTGDVVFGGGADKFVLNTCMQADVDESGNACAGLEAYGDLVFDHTLKHVFSGLETISKIGSGLAQLDDLIARGAAMSLQDGDLLLTGHLNLDEDGTLTIHDATRLIFGVDSATDYGRITADKVKFAAAGGQKVYLAGGSTLAANSDLLRKTGEGAGKFYDSDGNTEVSPGLYDLSDTLLTTVASDGVVSAGASADDLECGPVPTTGDPRTIICDEITYSLSNRGDDPGIEYEFASTDTNHYAINVRGAIAVATTADNDFGLFGRHSGSGDLSIAMSGGSIQTDGTNAEGLYGRHSGSGHLAIAVSGGSIQTDGANAEGLYGLHSGSGHLAIAMSGGSIHTEGSDAFGILGDPGGSGDLAIAMSGGDIQTEGSGAYGILGNRGGSGDLAIEMSDGRIRTEGGSARGLYGYHFGSGDLTMAMSGGNIETTGRSADGIYAGQNSAGDIDIAMSGGNIETTGQSPTASLAGTGARAT